MIVGNIVNPPDSCPRFIEWPGSIPIPHVGDTVCLRGEWLMSVIAVVHHPDGLPGANTDFLQTPGIQLVLNYTGKVPPA